MSDRSVVQNTEFLKDHVKPRIETIEGVGAAPLFGALERNIRIWLDGDALSSRGEAPLPLYRLIRDLLINRIFDWSNHIMRLFIAREALDVHLKVAGDAVMPGVALGKRLATLVRAGPP